MHQPDQRIRASPPTSEPRTRKTHQLFLNMPKLALSCVLPSPYAYAVPESAEPLPQTVSMRADRRPERIGDPSGYPALTSPGSRRPDRRPWRPCLRAASCGWHTRSCRRRRRQRRNRGRAMRTGGFQLGSSLGGMMMVMWRVLAMGKVLRWRTRLAVGCREIQREIVPRGKRTWMMMDLCFGSSRSVGIPEDHAN